MRTFFLFTVLLASAASASSPAAPEGYRFPTASDIKGSWLEFQKNHPKPYFAQVDLNGDKRKDEAWILLKEKGEAWALFVFLSKADGGFEGIKFTEGAEWAQNQGLSLAEPGKYRTACGKGYGAGCAPGEPETIDLKRGALNFFTFESASSVIYWDDSQKALKQVWTSD